MGRRRITAQELLKERSERNKRLFRDVHLSNQSFQGQDLSGIRFIGSKILGCNFQDANLRGTSFVKSKIGISFRQHINILVYGPTVISDVPHPTEDFIVSLCFALPWTFGIAIVFTIILIGLLNTWLYWLSIFISGEAPVGEVVLSILRYSVGISMISGLLFFDLQRTLKKYRESKLKSICNNFRNANFESASFHNVSINNCAFQHCSLLNTSLKESSLTDSDFSEANLKGFSLRGSQLTNTKFSVPGKVLRLLSQLDGKFGDFRGTNLSGFDLSDVNLEGADLTGANLISSNLKNANMEKAIMEGCDARNINLEGANLVHANLLAADLSIANLNNSRLSHANLTATRLMGARLQNAELTGACIASWQISNTKFKGVKCRYIFLEFSYDLREYLTRVPENENDFLGDKEFEENVSQVYKIMAQVLRYGSDYVDEIKKELVFIERASRDKQAFEQSLERLKQLIESFDQRIGEVSKSPVSVMIGQILSSAGDMKMSGSFFKSTTGGSSHDNVIQSDNISGNSTIGQSTSASWSSQNDDDKQTIIDALEQIASILNASSLSDQDKEATKPYIDVAKNEAKKELPRKEKIIENIEDFRESVESLSSTTDAVQGLINKLKGPCAVLAKTLGLAFSFLP